MMGEVLVGLEHYLFFQRVHENNKTEAERKVDPVYQAHLQLQASRAASSAVHSTEDRIKDVKTVYGEHCKGSKWPKYCHTLSLILVQASRDRDIEASNSKLGSPSPS